MGKNQREPLIKLTVLVEDRKSNHFFNEHGLSLFIEDENINILFDTGQSDNFIKNAQILHIDLRKTNYIVLSHGHYDHTGGLPYFLQIFNKDIPIIANPDVIKDKYSAKYQPIKYIGMPKNIKGNFEFYTKPKKISAHVYFMGEIERTYKLPRTHFFTDPYGNYTDYLKDDTSLVIATENSISIICGCCHSGLINTIEMVKKMFPQPIDKILGGFHLIEPNDKIVNDTITYLKNIDFNFIGISHCTSDDVGQLFIKEFPEKAKFVKIGEQICF